MPLNNTGNPNPPPQQGGSVPWWTPANYDPQAPPPFNWEPNNPQTGWELSGNLLRNARAGNDPWAGVFEDPGGNRYVGALNPNIQEPQMPDLGGGGGGGGGRGGGGRGSGGGGGGHAGGGGGGGGGGASPGIAEAFHGQASLIDMDDPIFSLFAPKPWMSGMLSMGREYTQAATEDALRLQRDQSVRSGISTSSPAYLYMVAMQRRNQQQQLSNALREAQLAWTLPAANRRAGALSENAQLGTSVSMGNADASTRVSMANAGYATQSSIANAGNATQSSIAAGQLGLGYAGLAQSGSQFQSSFAAQEAQRQFENRLRLFSLPSGQGPGFVAPSGPGFGGYGNAAFGGAQAGLNFFGQFGGGGDDDGDNSRSQGNSGTHTVTPPGGYAYNVPD